MDILEAHRDGGRELVDGCMWLSPSAVVDDEDAQAGDDEAKVTIAWRYENMKRVETTVSASAKVGESVASDDRIED